MDQLGLIPHFSIDLFNLDQWTPSKTFNPSRGIRKGYPMSLFIFILVAKGLGRYIKLASQYSHLKGLNLWGSDLPITHQQFVDDIMLFCKFTLCEVRKLRYIIHESMQASRNLINNDKSNILFFKTPILIQTFLALSLGFVIGSLPIKYFGMPLVFNSLRNSCWKYILQKIQSKLNGWDFRDLNLAGRVILIKYI